jgi:hypothetical protein
VICISTVFSEIPISSAISALLLCCSRLNLKTSRHFSGERLDNTINVLLPEFGGDLLFNMMFVLDAQFTDQAGLPFLVALIFLECGEFGRRR